MSGVTKMDVLDSVGIANKPTLPSGRVMGRNFDDDSDDDIHIGEELVNLSTQFERASAVLSSPAKCGVFVNYLFTQNRDPVPALFYLVNQYYQYIMRSSKELLKDQRRVNVEIFTSFLHEKSPLRVDIPTPVVAATVDMMNTAAGMSTFKMAADAALSIVQAQVTKLAQEIRHGMDTWKPPESINILVQRTREEELAIFELCLTGRLQSLYQQATAGSGDSSIFTFSDSPSAAANLSGITYGEQAAQALCLALVTAYRYFSTPGVGGISCSESMDTASVTGHSIRNTLFARSFENLSGSQLGVGIGNATGSIGGSLSSTGSNMWTKLPSFCTRFKQKSHSHLFGSRKLKYSQKNHSLQERAFEQVTECSICGHLLWGLAPQGLACNNCDLSVHSKCKSSIRDTCTKEGRRSTLLNVPTSVGSTNGFPPAVDSSPDRVKSHNLLSASLSPAVPINSSGGTQGETVGSAIAAFTEALSDTVASQARVPGENINISPSAWNQQSAGGAGVSENVSPTSAYESHTAGTENGASDSLPGDSESLKQNFSGGEDQNSPEGDPRLVNRMRNRFEPSEGGGTETTTVPTRSDSVVSTSSTITGIVSALDRSGEAGSTAADSVPELVTTDWSDDPEMMAGESFEAAVELRRQFPDYQMPPEGSKSEKYIRTLCLLEFHQKCQYMVRHLKQYDYLLLRRWPPEHQALARILCLDQIPELIQLFRSLVACIERTKTAQGYKEMAEAVLAWLTDNSCANLKTWSLHCQALSCSNMLDCVKTIVRDYVRRSPDILPLLQTRHNKFVLIDGLKHMRILYFNLPLIANNIVKDLQKKTKSYKDEAKVWQQIHARLVSLPQTIDDVCMPLVKRINSGQITSNLDRKDVLFRQNSATIAPFQDLLLNFPRVLFRYWVVANAEVAVDKLTVTSANKVNHDYIRERTDMLSIMLHDALLFLVKDSDRFVLRAFKATREHGGGYGPERIPSTPVISTVTPDRSTLSSASFSGSVQSTTTASTVNVTSVAASGIHSNGAATNSPTGPPSVAHSGLVSVVASVAGTSISDRASGSGSLKLAPVFPLNNMFTSCGEKFGRDHLLNIVFMDPTVLVRVLFSKEEQRQHWFNLLRQNSIVTGPRVASMHHQRSKRPISPIKPSSPRSPAAQPSGSVSPLQRVPSEPLSKLSSAEKEGYGNGSNPAVFPPPAPTPKTPPFSVSVDLTSSVEEIVSPADRLHRIINEYNRLNEQMRQAICETYHVSEEDMEKRSLNINAEGVRNIDDLLLLQVEFTREWLHSLSQTLYQTLHRRGTLVSSPFIADEDAAAAEKHRSSLSCSRICDSADLLDSAPKSALPCTAGASSDTLEKRQFTCSSPDLFEADSLTAQPVSRAGRGTVVTVQDHRRSKRRTKSELLETEDNNAADFDSLPIEQLQELLAKTTRAIQQCTKLVNRRSTVPLEHDRVATILAQQSSILNLDTASSNELLSSGESLKVSLSDELQRKDSGTLKPPSSQEVESSKKSDDIPKVASEEEGEQEGRHPRLAPIASGETRGSSDESLVLEDLEPGEHSLSYIIDDVARDLVNATIESALEVTDGGDPMALNVDPSPEKQQSLKSSNIRDSGCVPCVTDDEEGIAEEVETKEDNLETETTTGSPELDIELTPTMAPRSSDVLDELSEYVPPRDVEEIQLKDKGTSNIGPEEGGTDCPSIQFKEPDPVQTNLSSVSVGRADSQKSTTSSGFVESGDD
ncbi:unnamed protein product [Calicophoron daubneyi]